MFLILKNMKVIILEVESFKYEHKFILNNILIKMNILHIITR